MFKVPIIWARKGPEETPMYQLSGVDKNGTYYLVLNQENTERIVFMEQTMKRLLKNSEVSHNTQWWKDLCVSTNLMSFMMLRQQEALELHEKRNTQASIPKDIAIPRYALSKPYCPDSSILSPQHQLWKSFILKLAGDSGIQLILEKDMQCTWKCDHTFTKTTEILSGYIKEDIDIEATLDFFRQHNGTCDCTVLFNVMENFYGG